MRLLKKVISAPEKIVAAINYYFLELAIVSEVLLFLGIIALGSFSALLLG